LQPIEDRGHQMVVAVITDLTEQKLTERALDAERLARSVLEQTGEAIVVCDRNGLVIRASDAVTRLAGRDPLFQNIDDLLPLRSRDGKRFRVHGASTRSQVRGAEVCIDRKDGLTCSLFLNADALRDGDGTVIGTIVTLTDVSPLMEAQRLSELRLEESRQANAELAAIESLSLAGLELTTLDQLTHAVVSHVAATMHADSGALLLAAGEDLQLVASVPPQTGAPRYSIQEGAGFAGAVAAMRRTLFLHDAKASRLPRPAELRGLRSLLGVPLANGDRLIGVLQVGWEAAHESDVREQRFMEIIAARVATVVAAQMLADELAESLDTLQAQGEVLQAANEELAAQGEELRIRHAELEAQRDRSRLQAGDLARRNHFSDALNRINALVHSTRDFDQVMLSSLEEGVEALGLPAGVIESREGDDWVVRYQHGLSDREVGHRLDDAHAPFALRAQEVRHEFYVPDLRLDPDAQVGLVQSYEIRSLLAAPLVVKDEMIGCLLFYGREPREFDETELDFAAKLAAAASLALENSRLFAAQAQAKAQVDQELEVSSLLLEAANALASWTDRREMLASLADLILKSTRHSRVLIGLCDQTRHELRLVAARGLSAGEPHLLFTAVMSDQGREALRWGRPKVIDAAAADMPETQREYVEEHGYLLGPVAPMVYRDRLVGVIAVDEPGERRAFGIRDIEVVESIAAQASVAIENARLFEAQSDIARTLQESLLHPLPEIDGLELAEFSLPANRAELVGGDFRDVFHLPEGRVMILIGDVMGKSIEAATLTETMRSAARTAALVSPAPAVILDHVNRMLLHEGERLQMVTALIALLDPADGRIELASAGHPPAVHLSADRARLIEMEYGTPLGVFDQSYAATTVRLGPGETLVLYTDGVTEARHHGVQFGEARLLAALRGAGGTASDVIARLQETLLGFTSVLQDDVQVLVIRAVQGSRTGQDPSS
jgi:PAS domain S-box-containing protein